jgi:ribonuclease P protein component
MRRGKRIAGECIQLVMQKNEADVSRFSCVVSTKIDKRATRRNRMKRVIYESIQHLLPRLHDHADYIIFVKKDFSGKLQTEVESMVGELLKKAGMFD